jgi:hypothetical protein
MKSSARSGDALTSPAAAPYARNSAEASISPSIEHIKPKDWAKQVYRPDIPGGRGTIYKQPGYNPLGQE